VPFWKVGFFPSRTAQNFLGARLFLSLFTSSQLCDPTSSFLFSLPRLKPFERYMAHFSVLLFFFSSRPGTVTSSDVSCQSKHVALPEVSL